jgi:DNA-binding Xre family transcriptional regulator
MSINNCQNNLKKILDKKGVRPTDEKIIQLGFSLTKFKRLYNNTAKMTAEELLVLAEWLEIDHNDLIDRKKSKRETSIVKKHKLVKV